MRVIRKKWRRLRRVPEVALVRLGFALVPRLPRAGVVALARGLGRLAARLPGRNRRVAEANLTVVYGDGLPAAERARILAGSAATMALTLLDLFWFSRDTAARVARYVRFDDSADPLLAPGAAVFVTAHFGNWEIMGMAGALRGQKTVSVAKPLRNPAVSALLNGMRGRTGQRIVPAEGALRGLVGALREGAVAALLLDQDVLPAQGGVFVEFFGLPVPMSTAASGLAAKFECPLHVGFCVHEGDGSYRVFRQETLRIAAGEPPAVATARVAAALERAIRARPDQWLWMYKRWKRVPEGHAGKGYPYYAERRG